MQTSRLAAAAGGLIALLAVRAHAWQRAVADTAFAGFDLGVAAAVDAAGDVVVAGTRANPAGGSDFVVVKLDRASGTELWRRTMKGTKTGSRDEAFAVGVDADGDVLAAGATENTGTGVDFTVVKLAGVDGSPLWPAPATISGTLAGSFDQALTLAVDPSSGDVVAAGFTQNTTTINDFTVAKFAGADGSAVWPAPVTLSGTSAVSGDIANAVAVDGQGDVVAVGRTVNASTGADFTVVKLAGATGAALWPAVVTIDGTGPDEDEAFAVVLDAANDVVAAGRTSNGGTGTDFTVVKLAAADGAPLWPAPVTIDGTGGIDLDEDVARAVALDAGGNVLAAGVTIEDDAGVDVSRFTVVKLAAADGAEAWRAAVSGTAAGSFYAGDFAVGFAIAADAAGNAVAAGPIQNTGSGRDAAVAGLAAASGAELWRRELSGTAGGADTADAVVRDPSGDVVVAGRTDDTGSGKEITALRIGCAGGEPVECVGAAPVTCRLGGLCDPATGACASTPLPDGTACDDGDACTRSDGCVAGTCTGADPVVCEAGECAGTGACEPATGRCTGGPAPDGTACDDGDACTHAERCGAGVCAPPDGEAVSCDLGGALTAPDCASDKVPRGVRRGLARARALVERALGTADAARANRLLGRAATKLGRTAAAVERATRRRRRPLSAGCAEALRAVIAASQQRIGRLVR